MKAKFLTLLLAIGLSTISFAQTSVNVNTMGVDVDCLPDMVITYEYPAGVMRTTSISSAGGVSYVDFPAVSSVFDIISLDINGIPLVLATPNNNFWHTFQNNLEFCCDGVLYSVTVWLDGTQLMFDGGPIPGGGIACPQDDNNDPQG